MTDTRAWTTAAEAVSPADTPSFGAAEVAYAVSLTEGEARERAVRFLQLAPDFVTEQIAALGASSLLARGELSVDGDALVPRGGIRLLIAVLQRAVRWTEIAMIQESGVEAALYVQSPELSVLLSPAAMSTWTMVVRRPAVSDAALLAELVSNNAARHPDGTAYFGTELVGSASDGSGKIHLFVRPDGEG
ncbi:MAG: hypothetical protein Q7T71_09610, partial [Herbiconiux sp.]|nr:hypothetical protein [Herbiconiux sp.]